MKKIEFFLASFFIHASFLFFFLPESKIENKIPVSVELKPTESSLIKEKSNPPNPPMAFKKEEKIEQQGFKKTKVKNSFYGIGISASCYTQRSLKIDETFFGYPAQQVGLRGGDEILSINGYKINTTQDCLRIRSNHPTTLNLIAFRPSTGETFEVSLPTQLIETN